MYVWLKACVWSEGSIGALLVFARGVAAATKADPEAHAACDRMLVTAFPLRSLDLRTVCVSLHALDPRLRYPGPLDQSGDRGCGPFPRKADLWPAGS
jgi:hypothetical protein